MIDVNEPNKITHRSAKADSAFHFSKVSESGFFRSSHGQRSLQGRLYLLYSALPFLGQNLK